MPDFIQHLKHLNRFLQALSTTIHLQTQTQTRIWCILTLILFSPVHSHHTDKTIIPKRKQLILVNSILELNLANTPTACQIREIITNIKSENLHN